MKKLLPLIFFCIICCFTINSQITLSHNVGTTPIKTNWESCENEESWARTFTLAEFGISTTEQLIIRSAQTAISNSYNGALISIFNRFGKLVTKFTIDDIGWDGTSNGKPLISNDYWFYIELLDLKGNTRNRTGNFSLLRK